MFLDIAEDLARRAAAEAQRRYGLEPAAREPALTPRFELGDLAFAFPLELARRAGAGLKPREVALALLPALEGAPFVRRVDVAGPGYLNVYLDRPRILRELYRSVRERRALGRPLAPGKVIIEHTNINPNKSAHVGHVRNAVLGDTLARALRELGHEVEVQNYIDDTGVQVADVVVGFLDIEGKGLEQVKAIPGPFDRYCWDLYARVGKWYEEDRARERRRQEVLKAVEEGGNSTAELAAYVAATVVGNHLATAARLGIRYDLLAWEGDILRRGLWARTFEQLKRSAAVHHVEEGKNAGCWVMRLEGTAGFEGLEDADKVLVRSNGTATYVAKDIAYQMWKFGLSAVDFGYRPVGEGLWSTSSDPAAGGGPGFGHAARVYNVIDVRQSYLQDIVRRGLEALGYGEQARNSIHYSYEMVALTPRCAERLGFALDPEDRKRPYVEMSGRKGLGVKADDLLDEVIRLATEEVRARSPELEPEQSERIGREIGVGAVRYFMLRFGRTKVVAFDFEEALKFQGETGPYLQNSVVRCHSIFRKLEEREGLGLEAIAGLDAETGLLDLSELEQQDIPWDLVFSLARADEALRSAVSSLELSSFSRWAFHCAQRFHKYYEGYRILGEPSPARRLERAVLVWTYRERLTRALEVMGIPVPERM